ncbi:hypothetical protein ACHAQA_007770 [Verticillium albo-atrum]
MEEQERARYEAQSRELRADLKTWETAWAKSHDGKKPGRDDIKQNAEIAQKYKQYNKTRDILSGKVPPPTDRPRSEKRQSIDISVQTPSKRQKHLATPSKSRTTSLDITPSKSLPPLYDHANTSTLSIARHLFSPAAPRSIGPTPQRDGRVMGLFDLMPERELGTPSRANGSTTVPDVGRTHATPSKRSATSMEEGGQASTPSSSGKKRKTDGFITPLKLKNMNTNGDKTPSSSSSVSKLQFSTPAFLKRHSLAPVDENGEFPAAAPLRLPRKPLGRGLSAIVASLRKVEEEAHDDDMDALREMEQGGAGPMPTQMKPPPRPQDDILVADSQVKNLPLGGFDDEGMYDSDPEQQLGRDGQPLRIFKKKGQKRTTRRSNMKPVHLKRPTAPFDGETADNDDESAVVPETQMNPNKENEHLSDDLADFVPSDMEGSDAEVEKKPKKKPAKKETKKEEGPVKKTARKVNEFAHTNFRRLKLKNTGSKGGAGINSRFRRRR